jgi:hypothetical protein
MTRRALCAFGSVLLLAAVVSAQQPASYLEVMTVKVKPEKRAEFDSITKKIVDVNRRHGGDLWVASEVGYGEGNTISFIMPRTTLADVDKGMEMFMGAMMKAYGETAMNKLFQDFNNCIVSSRTELRRQRPDLSANVPTDPAAMERKVAESRWLRTNVAHVRPGRSNDVETQMKAIKAALEKADSKEMIAITQSVAGAEGTVYYITTFRTSIGGFEEGPSMMQILPPDAYEKYRSTVADAVSKTETLITRFVPELSNPPQTFITASPDYWTPKPTALARPAAATEKSMKKPKQQQ